MSKDELNWQVLERLGYKIVKPLGYANFVLLDNRGKIVGGDFGDPYSSAKSLNTIPLYSERIDDAAELIRGKSFQINAVADGTFYVSIETLWFAIGQDIAEAICLAWIGWHDAKRGSSDYNKGNE